MGIKLTVYFEDPFWVGVFERMADRELETARIVFGAEPKDVEVLHFIMEHFNTLQFSPPLEVEPETRKKINPKRLQRQIRDEVAGSGVGTKAQQAIGQAYEAKKSENRKTKGVGRRERVEMQFELRQRKKKARKKGH